MILLLTGDVHSGKTTLLGAALREPGERSLDVRGFLSESVREGDEILGYDLVEQGGERRLPLLRTTGGEGAQETGRYFLLPEGLAVAEEILLAGRDADLLVVDEVGPLELKGAGLWPALRRLLLPPATCLLLVVRAGLLADLQRVLEPNETQVHDLRDDRSPARLAAAILSLARRRDRD